MVADLAAGEALSVDRRVDDARLAPEVGADPGLGGERVGDVAVRPLGGDPVPLAPAPEGAAQKRPQQHVAAAGQRLLAVVPRVAERVVAVADVDRVLVAEDGVGPGRRARDDEVVAATGRTTRSRPGRAAAGRGTSAPTGAASAETSCGRDGRRTGPRCPSRRRPRCRCRRRARSRTARGTRARHRAHRAGSRGSAPPSATRRGCWIDSPRAQSKRGHSPCGDGGG